MVKILSSVVTLALIAWAALYLTGHAVLVKQSTPVNQAGGLLATTTCTYFDGLGLHDLEQTFSPLELLNDLAGGHSKTCARLLNMADSAL
jgi:hypothetical protein